MNRIAGAAAAALLLLDPISVAAGNGAGLSARYCVTITLDSRITSRITIIDLRLKNATILAVPRVPAGWQIDIQNQIEGDASLFGAALGGVARLGRKRLTCFVQIGRSFIDKARRIGIGGTITLSEIGHERRLVLQPNQIRLENVGAK